MKTLKKLSAFLIAGTIMISCTEQPATSYTIEGNFQGIPDGVIVELIPGATHEESKPVAEAVVTDGKFTFTGVADEPRLFLIHVAETRHWGKFMVENGEIELTGNGNHGFDNMVVKGSKSHDLYLQKVSPRKRLNSLYAAYNDNNKEILEAIVQARAAKNKALLDSLTQTDASKKLDADEKNFFETVGKITKGIIMDNKDSWWGPMLMLDFLSYFTEEYKPWYEEFSQEAKDSYYGKILKKELFPEGFVGKAMPTFTLTGKDNI